MRLLVLNAGSSSLKSSLIEQPGDVTVRRDTLDRAPGAGAWNEAVDRALALAEQIDAVGHRVVHGGAHHSSPLLVDRGALRALGELGRLAPLHNGPALEVIEATRRALPDTPQVACFDTAFHAGLPPAAHVYPLPYAWYTERGIRRFGFHGLSVSWALEQGAALLDRPAASLGLVVAHLGSGCSVTAVWDGRSADTSMGMTPLEGLMMGTRSGSVDPGIVLELAERGRLTIGELSRALQHESGLLGVSGVSADLRRVQDAAATGDARAGLALELFVRRAAAAIAAAATAIPRVDAVVFTGGIGEHATEVRNAICSRLAPLGVEDPIGSATDDDAVLSRPEARVALLRVAAREDLVIARQTERLLRHGS